MHFSRTRTLILAGVVASIAAPTNGCEDRDRDRDPPYRVDAVGLELPKTAGWIRDPEINLENENAGGTALRLRREGAPLGSPLIEVWVEEKTSRRTRLDTFLDKGLRDMAEYENKNEIRITRVVPSRVKIGTQRGHRVRHEYTMVNGGFSFTALTTYLVLDGRGITVTALGRTELFSPLEDSIRRILDGITTSADSDSNAQVEIIKPIPVKQLKKSDSKNKPVDLGKVGGK